MAIFTSSNPLYAPYTYATYRQGKLANGVSSGAILSGNKPQWTEEGVMSRVNADYSELPGFNTPAPQPIDQTPIGSHWMGTQPQGQAPGGLLGNYGQMSGTRGGNWHEALKKSLLGNSSPLQGLLGANTPRSPTKPTYNFSGE